MSTPNLLDAIRVVRENERIASESYAEVAQKITNPSSRMLFEELAEFENYHYEQLSGLLTSLETSGDYVNYEGKEFPSPPIFEIKAAQEPNIKSVMKIISQAMDLEKEAETAYSALAIQIEDPRGYEMFRRLSDEEHNHYRILMDAYWTLTNLGTWKWSSPK